MQLPIAHALDARSGATVVWSESLVWIGRRSFGTGESLDPAGESCVGPLLALADQQRHFVEIRKGFPRAGAGY